MKPTDFAKYLTEFLSIYLPRQKNVSKNTIYSYRDTFKLLINYFQDIKAIPVEKVSLNMISSDLLTDFLEWLETDRKCSISTRNQRLAAVHSFFRYIQAEEPAGIFQFQKITAIPIKKSKKTVAEYLTPEAIKLLLKQPDKQTRKGRRDLTLISLLYDSGARVQELIDMKVCNVILQQPAIIILTGKGNKNRRVPIMKNTVSLLENYLAENKLDKPWKNENPLFTNNQRQKLTKEGVAYIISKYVASARQTSTLVPPKVKAHMLRHSKAMHLLQAGVNLIYIRDFLGHVDLRTTEIYARIDTETKRKAIENLYPDLIDSNLPDWSRDQTLLSWLSSLK
ncbi:MAG TPA: integrase [Lentisphaeria bacterium]|nr:MAG: integrase [Lentisphaerae bacterium GWF2_38_69]HBM16417.1 integrase [Lentisphaeria bacterium]